MFLCGIFASRSTAERAERVMAEHAHASIEKRGWEVGTGGEAHGGKKCSSRAASKTEVGAKLPAGSPGQVAGSTSVVGS